MARISPGSDLNEVKSLFAALRQLFLARAIKRHAQAAWEALASAKSSSCHIALTERGYERQEISKKSTHSQRFGHPNHIGAWR